MTATTLTNPIPGEQGIRIEQAIHHVATHLPRGLSRGAAVTAVQLALRDDYNLSHADYLLFAHMQLMPRIGFELDAWVMSIVEGDSRRGGA